MSLPANFASCPQEELHHHCRNVALELKKTIKSSKDISELKMALERYLNVVRHLDWHQKSTGVYHKDGSEKATNKLVREFNRYTADLESNQKQVNSQVVLDAVTEIEQLIQSL